MKVEDIIEGFNRHIDNKRIALNISPKGHVVLQKMSTSHPTFKAYKEYEYIVWFIVGTNKYPLITLKHTAKVINGNEESVIRDINIELSELIFNFIGSTYYEQIIKGEFNGYNNEQIPNSNNR